MGFNESYSAVKAPRNKSQLEEMLGCEYKRACYPDRFRVNQAPYPLAVLAGKELKN